MYIVEFRVGADAVIRDSAETVEELERVVYRGMTTFGDPMRCYKLVESEEAPRMGLVKLNARAANNGR